MSTISKEDTKRNGDVDDNHVQIDMELSNTNTNTEESKNEKSANNEVVVNMEPSKNNLKRDYRNKTFKVYLYPSNQFVYSMRLQGPPPSDNAPLDYSPDRNAFLRLVFSILFIMILATALITSLVFFSDDFEEFVVKFELPLIIIASVTLLAINYIVACTSFGRKLPCNIIILIVTVLAMSTLCCVVTLRYDTEAILYAVAATAGVVLVCFLLAFSSFDFTSWMLYIVMIVGAFAMLSTVIGLAWLVLGHYMPVVHLVILCIGVPLYMVMLTMEIQMVLGGRTVELSEDDYAIGAYMLYQLIVSIFLQIVQIFGVLSEMD